MFFTVGDGDPSKAGDVTAAAAPLMKEAGASSVRGSVTLTGEMTGKGVVSSIWDSMDSYYCLLYTSPSPRDATLSRMPSSA